MRYSVIANRYQIGTLLGEGGMGAVYRAEDRLSGNIVALKRVHAGAHSLVFNSLSNSSDLRVALAREFQTLASLRHPHIISVLDYGFDKHNQPFFTMPLLANATPITQAAQGKSIEFKVKLLIQLLQALHYLHRRGILHRDLKPSNVLVTPDAKVRVLDFGLAIDHEADDGIVGTVAYMAPELLSGGTSSIAADIYAVGVIAYELFTGKLPFDAPNSLQIMTAILQSTPDFALLDEALTRSTSPDPQAPHDDTTKLLPNALSMTVPGDTAKSRMPKPAPFHRPLTAIIEQMLQRSPTMRYADAQQAIRDLNAILEKPIADEPVEIRDSYLQAASFIGREKERDTLENALLQAMDGSGSAWLIGGESGVGKSRLVKELRTVAMVKGVPVLSGQGVAEGGRLYQFWQEPLRHLLLLIEVTDAEARILRSIVPDVPALIGYDPGQLSQMPNQEVLLDTIVMCFKRSKQPLLLLLEDLHWAMESLAVLAVLETLVHSLPLLILSTYRSEESPDLPQRLPKHQGLMLERLPPTQIIELSRAMLGEAGTMPHVVQFLQQETEGNCFFMVEVMRALAEEAGRLDNIARMSIPEDFVAGGVKSILLRRLQKVPAVARPLLNVAAIIGRELDLALLESLHQALGVALSFETWLLMGQESAVLEIQEGKWRFAHDKLREAVLAELPPKAKQDLHADVAEAIEKHYAAEIDNHAVILYNHWRQAKDIEKARAYAQKAARQAIITGRYGDALGFVEAIMSFQPSPEEHAHALFLSAAAQLNLGNVEAAKSLLEESETRARACGSRTVEADIYRNKAEIALAEGELDSAEKHARYSLALAKEEEDSEGLGATNVTLGNILRTQGKHEEALQVFHVALNQMRQNHLKHNEARILNSMAIVHYFQNRLDAATTIAQQALDITREINAKRVEYDALNTLGGFAWMRGQLQEAATFYRQAHELAEEISYKRGITALQNLASVYADLGDLDNAIVYYGRALETHEQLNTVEPLTTCLVNMAEMYNDNQDPQHALEHAERALTLSTRLDAPHLLCAANLQVGMAHLALANVEKALPYLQSAAHIEAEDVEYEAWVMLAIALIQNGDIDAARPFLDRAIKTTSQILDETEDLFPAWYTLGLARAALAYLEGTPPTEAIKAYRQGLKYGDAPGIRQHQQRLLKHLATATQHNTETLLAVLHLPEKDQ